MLECIFQHSYFKQYILSNILYDKYKLFFRSTRNRAEIAELPAEIKFKLYNKYELDFLLFGYKIV